jgi:LysM repeat protein
MKKLLLFAILCTCSISIFAQAKATTHKVAKGESLYAIAKKYHVTIAAIEKANNITGETKLKLGQNLNIPASSAAADTKSKTATTAADKKTDKPKPAADKSTTAAPKAAVKTDKKSTTAPKADAKAEKKPATPAAKPTQVRAANDNPSSHTVAKGESLYSLARLYGVSVRHLREANNMSDDAALKVGQKLAIPAKNPEADYKPAPGEAKKVEEKAVTAADDARQPGREYLSNDNEPVKKAEPKTEIKEPTPAKAEPTPVKVTEEKPSSPVVTDKPKEIIKEEKAPEAKEPKSPPAEPIKNTNVAPSDYVTVFNEYATKGGKKVVYRGIGSFLKSENPGNQYLALYNYADMGAILKVTNLMSKQAIYVKVIGKVSAADAQNEIILKVSSEAASQLKVSEDKFLVEVTGYNQQ